MSFSINKVILVILLSFVTSQTYFQIIPQFSFREATEESIANYTLSPEFELKDKTIVFNHKTTMENPSGSIITKFPIYVPDFELQVTMKLSSKSSDGTMFGIFFLNDYKEDKFDFNSQFNGFALIFTTAPLLFSKDEKQSMNIRLIKNLNNETVEDLLYSNNFVESECKDKLIVGEKFKFFARFKEGSLRTHFDNSDDLFNSCVRKPVMDFEDTFMRIAFLTYEGKNFLPDENQKFNVFDIKNDVTIYNIRLFNMKKDYRNRFSPVENFTLTDNIRYKFDDKDLFETVNSAMKIVAEKVDGLKNLTDEGKLVPKDKEIYEKMYIEYYNVINATIDPLIKVFKLEEGIKNDTNTSQTIENIFDFYRDGYHAYLENGVPIEDLELIRVNFDKYRKSMFRLTKVKEEIDNLGKPKKKEEEKTEEEKKEELKPKKEL